MPRRRAVKDRNKQRILPDDKQVKGKSIQQHKDDPYALNAVYTNGNTPLILAAIEGHGSIVELLLKNPHVDVNAVNNNGDTALSAAALMAWAKQGACSKSNLGLEFQTKLSLYTTIFHTLVPCNA